MNTLRKHSYIPAVLAVLALTATLFVAAYRVAVVEGASFPSAPSFSVATTSTAVAVTSSTRILATTTNPADPANSYTRAYATICNPSSTIVYLRLDGDKPASLSVGVYPIAAAAGYSACYEITDNRLIYSGSVQASSTNQTSTTLNVTQYVY